MDVLSFMKHMAIKLHELELVINSFVAHYNGEEPEIQEEEMEETGERTMSAQQMVNLMKQENERIKAKGIATGGFEASPLFTEKSVKDSCAYPQLPDECEE